ncbi:hypothetical protein HPB47_013626 [Ixodes persulcatus]|uniref:Uncharacterized protein n=1 Tax=Ixodes persulcatus TaxID=34615 RepID=A0AC60QYX8_IXOPE|nr:hypothetical protein HPB47_013626 [Ixodes persulcatus]
MSLINWDNATAEDLATLSVQFLKIELQRRNLSTVGNKEEFIDRLLTDATQNPPNALAPATLFPTMPAFTTDEAENMQRMAAFLHQNMAVMMTTLANQANQVHVTTLPDLSASLPTFNGGGTPTFKHWIEELERTQRLARWEDPTLLAIAQGKLRGVAADWHASTGRQLTTWTIWKAGMKEQFGEQLSLIQWQQKVTALTQKPGDSLQQYAFAKLKIMSRCPVPITDKERIEYLLQGIRDDQIATSIAVHRPRTVDDFLNIVSEVDRTIDHSRLARTPTSPKPTRNKTELRETVILEDLKVKELKKEHPDAFFMNGGDFYQGTAYYTILKNNMVSTIMTAMNYSHVERVRHHADLPSRTPPRVSRFGRTREIAAERESGLPSELTAVWSGSPGLDSGQRVESRRELVRPAMTPR